MGRACKQGERAERAGRVCGCVLAPLVVHAEAHALPAAQRELQDEPTVGDADVRQHVRTGAQAEDGHL